MQKGRWWGHQGGGIEAERKDVEKWGDAEKERRKETQREGTQRKSGERDTDGRRNQQLRGGSR